MGKVSFKTTPNIRIIPNYDRRVDTEVSQLSFYDKNRIHAELNNFKRFEMCIHPNSHHFTQFYHIHQQMPDCINQKAYGSFLQPGLIRSITASTNIRDSRSPTRLKPRKRNSHSDNHKLKTTSSRRITV